MEVHFISKKLQYDFLTRRNSKKFLQFARFFVFVGLIFSLTFQPGVVSAVDSGLGSGNAVVDRTTVPGQTIVKYQTVGNSSFTVPFGVTSVQVLVVGGGGGGGAGEQYYSGDGDGGGGGGAGGIVYNSSYSVTSGSTITVTVGAGGAGSTVHSNGSNPASDGANGGNSVFGSLTAIGGGGGGGDDRAGKAGGSGGGGGGECSSSSTPGGSGTSGQGNAGGGDADGTNCNLRGGNGGGSYGQVGLSATSRNGAFGGGGAASNISGTSIVYSTGGSGGGGVGTGTGAAGGNGAGAGGNANGGNGGHGAANTGAGGGGGGTTSNNTQTGGDGGNGGSGVVIVRFATISDIAPGTPDMTAATDSGSSNTDNVTNDSTPDFTGTCMSGEPIQLVIDGTAVAPTQTCANSTYTIAPSAALGNGAHTVAARSTTSGLTSATSSLTIDTTAPSAPGTPDLTAGTDTGTSNTDNHTKDTTPDFTGTCTNGDVVTLWVLNVAITPTQVCSGGSYNISTSPAFTIGGGTFTATLTDTAGNVSTHSGGLAVTFDTTAPAALSTAPDLAAGSDSGSSNSDNLTNDTTPTFTGSCTNGDIIIVLADGANVGSATCSGSAYSITTSTLTAGSRSITVVASDTAGNQSAASPSLSITIDTTAPSVPSTPDMTAATDSGSSNTDNVTNDTTPDFTGSCTTGDVITLRVNGVLVTPAQVCTNSTYTITPSPAFIITDGTAVAFATDATGNTSADSSSLAFTIDTTAPSTPAAPDLAASSDTGTSSTDNLTNDTTPTFSGSCAAGDVITMLVDGASAGTATCSGSAYSVTASAVAAGTRSITVTITDAAGNTSAASSGLSITIDTTAPAASGTPDLAAASDSGSSNTDNTTNDTTPTFTGSCTTGDSIALYIDGSSVASTTCAGGAYTITPSALGDGSHAARIQATDAAGNSNALSGSLTFIISATAPSTLVAPDMTDGTDSGTSSTDNNTNDTTPTFGGGCVNGTTVTLYVDGSPISPVTTCTSTGSYSITPDSAFTGGAHAITAVQTDVSGNTSSQSPELSITIDTTAPSAPAAPDLSTGSDSGSSSTDNITNDTTPTFTGSCTTGETMTLLIDGTSASSAVCAGSAYSITAPTVATSTHSATVTATDGAGNTSAAGSALSFTIDIAAPAAPAITAPSGGSTTNDTTPTFSGTGEIGATVTVTDQNSTTTCTATVDGDGNWSCTPSSALSGGSYSFKARQTDTTGNASTQSSAVGVTIDTTAPSAPVITYPADDGSTNDTTPTITGTGEAGATISLIIDEEAPLTTPVDAFGTWTFTPGEALSDDDHTLSATQTDIAGNVSAASGTTTFTIDTSALEVTVNKKSGQDDPTEANTIFFTVEFSKPVNAATFGTGDLTIDSSPGAYINAFTQLDSTTWEFEVKGMAYGSTVTASIEAGKVQDFAGNANDESTSTDNEVAYQAPAVNIVPQITNDTTPNLTGECGAEGNEVEIDISGPAPTATTTCSGAGTWNFTVPDALSDGTYDVVITDITAGNLTNPADNQTDALTIDTVVPTVTINQKSGQDDPTNIDSAAFTITFSKPIQASSFAASDLEESSTSGTVTALTQLSPTVWEAIVTGMDSGDNATLTLPASRVTHAAGNTNADSTSTDNEVTYDATAPDAPVITSPSDDSSTNDATPTITGTGEDGATITVYIDDEIIQCAEDNPITVSGGEWTCTPTESIADGEYEITAFQTDAAGNVSSGATAVSTSIDTAAPSAPAAADLSAGSDSGSSNTDNLTNDTTPTFTGSCTTGETIRVYSSDDLIGEQACSDSAYSITASELDDGAHDITVTTVDAVDNESSTSLILNITIDTDAPSAPEAPDMTATTDSGFDNPDGVIRKNDNITSDTTPDFTGACTAGNTITLYVDGNVAGSQLCPVEGVYTITSATTTEGNHTVTVADTDPAGNTSIASAGLAVVIDSIVPSKPTIVSPTHGTRTSDNTPTFSGAGETGTYIIAILEATNIHICGDEPTTVGPGNAWTCVLPFALSEGNHQFNLLLVDHAANISAFSDGIIVIIDTTAPPVPTPDLSTGSDSGSSNTDNITSDNTPTFSGSCTGSDVIRLYRDGTLAGQQTCSGGAYSITASPALADGTRSMTLTAADSVNNVSATSSALSITIDTDAPDADSPDLSASTDTGSSTTDNITSDTTPDFTGTCADGDTITLYASGVSAGTQTCSDSAYSITASTLADGEYEMTITAADVSGNTSSQSSAITVTIDASAPDAPDITAPSGGSTVSDATPTVTGTGENGTSITLLVDNVPVECDEGDPVTVSSGTWTCTPVDPLGDGEHDLSAVITDSSGNAQAASSTSLTIDTTAPTDPAAADLSAGSDTGNSNTDDLTRDTTPTVSGTCTDGDTIRLYSGEDLIGEQACSGSAYSITASELDDGEHALTIIAADAVGNTSTSSPAIDVTIDTTAPDEPAAPDINSESDTGISDTDNLTNDNTPTLTGSCEDNDTLSFYLDGSLIDQRVCSDSAYSFTPSAALEDGSHAITVIATDPAGNASPEGSPLTLVIDTSTKAAPIVIDPIDGTATDDTTPTFTGTDGQPDATAAISITISGTSVCEATPDDDGDWSCTPSADLDEGVYALRVIGEDAAGNPTNEDSYSLTIDTSFVSAPTVGSPTDGEELSDTTPTFSGQGESGSTVTIRDEYGNTLCTAVVDGNSDWSCDSVEDLSEGTHTIAATQTDADGNVSTGTTVEFVIIVDTDGVSAATEDAAPNGGDGNGDGRIDSEQGDVTSIPDPVTGGYATIELSSSACPNVERYESDTESELSAQDSDYDYPTGLKDFEISCFEPGGSITITIYLDRQYDTSDWEYRKFNADTGEYSDMSSEVSFGTATVGGAPRTTITFTATDGGPLDEDGVANGIFTDPSGPAVSLQSSSPDDSSGGSSGSSSGRSRWFDWLNPWAPTQDTPSPSSPPADNSGEPIPVETVVTVQSTANDPIQSRDATSTQDRNDDRSVTEHQKTTERSYGIIWWLGGLAVFVIILIAAYRRRKQEKGARGRRNRL